MRFTIEPRPGYVRAALSDQETPEQMREFLVAVSAACQQNASSKVVLVVRRSRPAFKPEDYGLTSYVRDLVTAECQVALVGDTEELRSAHGYVEMLARQQNINARAFRDEAAALRWLRNPSGGPVRRYRFSRVVIAGAPDEQGVYALWDGEEVIYYGRGPIRSRLLDHFYGRVDETTRRATHYGWELCADPAAREAELIAEHRRVYGRPPRLNAAA
ncbi:MAG TPA: hypothetical protein VFZ54_14685 [Burkholderiales bacterium]